MRCGHCRSALFGKLQGDCAISAHRRDGRSHGELEGLVDRAGGAEGGRKAEQRLRHLRLLTKGHDLALELDHALLGPVDP